MVHATEQDNFIWCQIGYQLDTQQDAGDATNQVSVFFGKEQVLHEHQQEYRNQA